MLLCVVDLSLSSKPQPRLPKDSLALEMAEIRCHPTGVGTHLFTGSTYLTLCCLYCSSLIPLQPDLPFQRSSYLDMPSDDETNNRSCDGL